jgi:two-component system response regulator FixJ
MTDSISVALIDDDEAVLDALASFLQRRGLDVATFPGGRPFLDAMDSGSKFDCIVTDVRMPDMSGLELQRLLNARVCSPPLIIITGHGDVDMAVTALKAGAADFIEKPTDDDRLLESVKSAVRIRREALRLAITGLSNKEIAARLGISPRTVEHYREWAMERMQAGNFAELVQMAAQMKLIGRKDGPGE